MQFNRIRLFVLAFIISMNMTYVNQAVATSAESSNLVQFSLVGRMTAEQAQKSLEQHSLASYRNSQYAVNLYKILYRTVDPHQNSTLASGMLVVPQGVKQPLSLLSYQHGTVTKRTQVPSNPESDKTQRYAAWFASAGGYVLAMADYLGLGDNDLSVHPYVQPDSLATSSADLLTAAHDVLAQLSVPMDKRLFLVGYSEGGSATLALHRLLEQSHDHLTVTASAPGAGPYNMEETIYNTLTKPGMTGSFYTFYYIYALHKIHGYWQDLKTVFVPPYDQLAANLLDGTYDFEPIVAQLPETPKQLLQPSFYQAIIDGKEPYFQKIRETLIQYRWKPEAPICFVAAKGDEDVPFLNSELAYQAMKQKKAQVTLINVGDDLGHDTGAPKVFAAQLDFFERVALG